jgi:hypothetical protein
VSGSYPASGNPIKSCYNTVGFVMNPTVCHRPVAQLGRASVSKTEGSEFDSWLACLMKSAVAKAAYCPIKGKLRYNSVLDT